MGIFYHLTVYTGAFLIVGITALQPRGLTSMEKEKEYLTLKDLIASEMPTSIYLYPIRFVKCRYPARPKHIPVTFTIECFLAIPNIR
jgi:hypothetical protein